jgi:hypothetical protein
LIPVLKLLHCFAAHVLEMPTLAQVFQLKLAGLLLNLGMQEQGNALKQQVDSNPYVLNEEEKKVEFEKIKGLRDLGDDLNDKNVSFANLGPREAMVLETI